MAGIEDRISIMRPAVKKMTEIKRLLKYSLNYKWWFIGGSIMMVLMVFFELLGPLIIMTVLDDHIRLGEGNINVEAVIRLLIIYALIKLFHAIVAYFAQIILQSTGAKVVQSIRHQVFEHIQKLPVKYFDNLPAGKVVARITNDTESMLEFFTYVLPMFLVNGLTMMAITVAIFIVNIYAGIIMLIFVPIILLWIIVYRKYSNDYNHMKRERNSDMNAAISESINGMTTIQVFNREKQIESEFKDLNDEYTDSATKLVKLNGLSGDNLAGVMQSFVFALMVIVFSLAFLSPSEALTVGTMYLLVDYITRFFNPLYEIVGQIEIFEQARVASVKVFEMIDEEEEIEDKGTLDDFDGDIDFRNVSFFYKEGHLVLKEIDLSVGRGETIALVGHTGSGKSSIINLLMRFYDPTEGRVLFSGKDTKHINKKELRKHVSIVLQDPFIYAGTLLYNIRLNNEDISREAARAALLEVGGRELMEKLDRGMDAWLPERGATLSLGERQLISFARALAFDPKVLVLDEATSNVDSETEQMIQNAMKVVSRKRTTFIIAHRLSTIQHADQIIILEEGNIMEQGNHQSLMDMNGIYAEMFKMQVMDRNMRHA